MAKRSGTDERRTTPNGRIPMELRVIPFGMDSAGDATGIRRALARVPQDRLRRLAVVAKIEGTATLNDSSRELASARIASELARAGGPKLAQKALEILSAGCEGLITPGGWLIASLKGKSRAKASSAPMPPGLVMGTARSAPIRMQDRAGPRHVALAADAVRLAMREAGLDAQSVALVLIKSPILMPGSAGPISPEQRRHIGSTGASRGAAALGAAIALGEIRGSAVNAGSLCADASLHGARTMAFSGTDTDCCEAVVFGHRPGGDASLRLDRAMLSDLIDRAALERLAGAGGGELRAMFFKAGMAAGGMVRGQRTTVLSSELAADKQLRAAASGVVGAVLGTTRAFISGGAEHQAAPGGCLAAVIRQVVR